MQIEKPPPEVLEHLKAAKIKYINFSIADYFGNVKGVEMNYIDFLKSKVAVAKYTGFDVDSVNPALFAHQADTVKWCLKGGRRAVFASFGNGKTVMGLEIAHKCAEKTGKQSLICLPLGVRQEFIRDAEIVLGYEKPVYVRNMAEIKACKSEILLTNYERVRDGDIDPTYFDCTVLDEAAVLRDFGSKTYKTFLDKFKGVAYKFVMTATPDPNKYNELIHYAGYLEIMDTGQALTRFFQRDSTKANNLTIYPHKEKEFWLWVSSWALFYTKPSDLNPEYSDEGYNLPELKIIKHRLITSDGDVAEDLDGQMKLFEDAAVGLKSAARIKRHSIKQRVAEMKRIVEESPDDHFILWHDREEERHEIKRAVPSVCEVYGSQDLSVREQNIIDFSEGKTQYLATKKCISGSGCNFQRHCHRAIFVGIDYEFNDFIQAIHRIYRFLQTEQVIIDIIYMDTEDEILKELFAKWERYKYQTAKMVEILKTYGLSNKDTGVAEQYMNLTPEPTEELADEIRTAEAMIKHLNEYDRMTAMQAELDGLKAKSDEYTEKIELARSLPAEILETATLPIEGLTVENGIPLIHGLPVSNRSDGEKLELCVDIAVHNPAGLKIILIDGAEKLDDESRERLYQRCREKGLQFIATRTTNDNELIVTEF